MQAAAGPALAQNQRACCPRLARSWQRLSLPQCPAWRDPSFSLGLSQTCVGLGKPTSGTPVNGHLQTSQRCSWAPQSPQMAELVRGPGASPTRVGLGDVGCPRAPANAPPALICATRRQTSCGLCVCLFIGPKPKAWQALGSLCHVPGEMPSPSFIMITFYIISSF